ncbi:MAG TPA: LysR family transcriptional regulator [Hanamia sp.]|nr:LysR family transcriptional regulator [Hanamia sp.]
MNFNQLKYIFSVDKHRNFARAADECGIAQSTLSKEIQRLEKEFRVMIFDRSKHPVVPTMKGIDLIKHARNILNEQEQFINIAFKKNNLPYGDFRLGIIPGLAPYLLPLFTQQLSQKYPQLNLKIFEIGPKEMLQYFENDNLDGALTISPFLKNGFYEDPLFEERFVLYLSPKHPLSSLKVVKWNDIPTDDLILQEDIKNFLLKSDSLQTGLSVPVKKIKNLAFENGSLETIRKIIDRNGGLTLLPHLATLYMGDRRLKMVREIESPALTRTIIFVTSRGFEKNRNIKAVKKEIIANVPKEIIEGKV